MDQARKRITIQKWLAEKNVGIKERTAPLAATEPHGNEGNSTPSSDFLDSHQDKRPNGVTEEKSTSGRQS